MDKSKLIVIANVTSRTKIEELGINQDNVIYKPLTLSKLKEILLKSATAAPQIVEEVLPAHATKFDAKVLVTEDNIINQKLIKRILEEHGITVDLANNGLESFEKRRSNNYDLLFMDIQMPVMDGIEATHEILDYEEDEEVPHVPIVALTANALKGDRERFLNEGMDEYITKPIETAELLYVLNKFLSDKSNLILTEKVPQKQIDKVEAVKKEVPREEVKETTPIQTPVVEDTIAMEDTLTLESSEEETPLVVESEKVETPSKVGTKETVSKTILIAKKFLLERRVLIKVIENLGYTYESLEDMDTFAHKLNSGAYDIIFADNDLITDDISQISNNLDIITTRKSKEEIEDLIHRQRG